MAREASGNFAYAVKRLIERGYHVENLGPNCARVYYKDKSGDFSGLCPCNDKRGGTVSIEGIAQNIDEWIEKGDQ